MDFEVTCATQCQGGKRFCTEIDGSTFKNMCYSLPSLFTLPDILLKDSVLIHKRIRYLFTEMGMRKLVFADTDCMWSRARGPAPRELRITPDVWHLCQLAVRR
jgi:hypothetical protein